MHVTGIFDGQNDLVGFPMTEKIKELLLSIRLANKQLMTILKKRFHA